MALDPRKRQRKAERRNAKQKAKKREMAAKNSDSPVERLKQAAKAPVLHCLAMKAIWQEGMGVVLLSRRISSVSVAYASFLIDIYCLGVKDAFSGILPFSEYDERLFSKYRDANTKKLSPEQARKLVEGAVEYAHSFGFAPHADYARAKLLFGDIDTSQCEDEFEYGRNGKPFFVSGPYDSPDRCRQILSMLSHASGSNGAYHLIPIPVHRLTEHGLTAEDIENADWETIDGEDADVVEGRVVRNQQLLK